jgi:L-glyceraldehyde 3-phosphate reductase
MRVPSGRLGPHGPEASLLALGSWHVYDRMRFEDAVRMLRAAVDAGITLFDVGMYGGTEGPGSFTDVLFGRIVQAAGVKRDEYVLSEKLWLESYPRESLAVQLDRALLRVGTDYADIGLVGDLVDPGLELDRLVRDLGELVRAGQLRSWGVNNWRAGELHEAYEIAVAAGLPTPQVAQLKYSVCRRSIPEGDPYRRLFDQSGIVLEASDVFEGGILAGKLKPGRPIGRDPGGIREAIVEAAQRLGHIARELDATPAQLCIAFCLTHPGAGTVLFGASSVDQLEENLGAVAVLERHGADEVRATVEELWLDRDVVSPEAGRDAE